MSLYRCFHSKNYHGNNPDLNVNIYMDHCGFDNVIFSWGHDEYLYRILLFEKNKHNLPEEALYMIRFHSLYAYHDKDSYKHFMSDKDKQMKQWLKLFNKYDLYSKSDTIFEIESVKSYYVSLLNKFFNLSANLWILSKCSST